MNNQNISILGRDAHMNSSESEHCCNPLCQLYDPMSAISFMRECISEQGRRQEIYMRGAGENFCTLANC
jgi:hypothetical protein